MSSTYDSSLIALLGAFAAIVIGGIISAVYFKNDTSPPKKPRSTQPPTSTESLFVVKESEFPANWFDGKEVFELEKRAIFSKSWIFIAHSSRFSKPGDYHAFAFSGFPFFLILGKDLKIRAFHNVCRHRAYTITKKESGSSAVLGCRYHGWSYNTRGELVKAPHFENVAGFDKSQNGLFEIATVVTGDGLVFVNLEAGTPGTEPDLEGVDNFMKMHRLAGKNKYTWVAGGAMDMAFNWKSAANPALFNLAKGDTSASPTSFMRLFPARSPHEPQQYALSVFPNSAIYKVVGSSALWYSIMLLPSSEKQTRVRWDLYSTASKIDSPVLNISKQVAAMVEGRIKDLESTDAQALTGSNTDTQYEILLHLKTHLKLEKTLGKEITPALRASRTSQKYLQADIMCKELDCLSKTVVNEAGRVVAQGTEVLAW